jgi:sulfate adenylyltransferase subunit 2
MAVNELFGLDSLQVWNTELAFQQLSKLGQAETKRTAERR